MAVKLLFSAAVFTAALALAAQVSAQIGLPAATLLLRINPSSPELRELVEVTLTSHTLDLTNTRILWYVDEKIVEDGVGLVSIRTNVGTGRTTTHVIAAVMDGSEIAAQTDAYIQPAEVDLLWESDSFVPPLYQGKRLASPNSVVYAEAHARLTDGAGTIIPPARLTYTWRKNGAVVTGASGQGKFKASFPAPLLFGTDTITVLAASFDGRVQAEKSISIPSVDPVAILYQDHPLFGVLYHAALARSSTLPDSEITIAGIPLFASGIHTPSDSSLQYQWRVNGKTITADPKTPHRLTINADNSSGLANIELTISSLTDIILHATGRWSMLLNAGFGSTGANNPFAPDTSI